MMEGDAWTAKMQGSLDLAHAHGVAVLEKEPVDFPCFASQGVFKFFLIASIQPAAASEEDRTTFGTYKSNYQTFSSKK